MFRRGEEACLSCVNAGRRLPPLPPPLGIEVPVGDRRVLSVRLIEGLVVLQTAEVMTSEVHAIDPLRFTSEITSRSRVLRVLSHLSVPVAALRDVQTALRRVARAR